MIKIKGKLSIFFEKKCNRLHYFRILFTLAMQIRITAHLPNKKITIEPMQQKRQSALWSLLFLVPFLFIECFRRAKVIREVLPVMDVAG
jgi:hypothetical protein